MELLCNKRCVIGEGPIWNAAQQSLYFVNPLEEQICRLHLQSGTLTTLDGVRAAAIAFDRSSRMILSAPDGVFYYEDGKKVPLYDTERYRILHANDMKVGPDGRLYVGTQSSRRVGASDKVDGKLYCIDAQGAVRTLLDGLLLSNGMDWSMDETRFYHTDSDTHCIKEYAFDASNGTLHDTARSIAVRGVDGFTIDKDDLLFAACWGQGHIAVIDTHEMRLLDYLPVPTKIPASCAFCGKEMDVLAVVTASLGADPTADPNAGLAFFKKTDTAGRLPYLFGTQP